MAPAIADGVTAAPRARRTLARVTHAAPLATLAAELDGAPAGAVCRRGPDGALRRAEPGPAGPLVLAAHPAGDVTEITLWGPAATPGPAIDAAVEAALAWCGARDDPSALADLAATDRRIAALLAATGPVRLSRVPRLEEALGRAVIGQLVQRVEARRSCAQLATAVGTAADGLWAWPTPQQLGSTPSWSLRRCGISGRGARSLHAASLEHGALVTAAARGWATLDARLRTLPGVGVWTSAETRLALGDPDAVSVGDANLPALIAHVLGGCGGDGAARRRARPPHEASDEEMLEVLEPFQGQRGRVVTLVKRAVGMRVVAGPPRRAPRAALSAHRYW